MAHRRKRRLSEEEIDETLSCPICLDSFTIPILQCRNKHLICETCYSKIKLINDKCPQCRARFKYAPLRSKKAEKMLEKYETVCRYASRGCREKRTYEDRTRHEKKCAYSTAVRCPGLEEGRSISSYVDLKYCCWEGDIQNLASHFRSCHSLRIESFTTNVASLRVDVSEEIECEVSVREWLVHLPLGDLYVQTCIEFENKIEFTVVPLNLDRTIKRVEVSTDYLDDEIKSQKPFYGMKYRHDCGRRCTFYFNYNELACNSPERFAFRVRIE